MFRNGSHCPEFDALRLRGIQHQESARSLVAQSRKRAQLDRDMALVSPVSDRGDDHLWALLQDFAVSILITGDRLLLGNPPRRNSVISPKTGVNTSSRMHDPVVTFAAVGVGCRWVAAGELAKQMGAWLRG